MLVHTKRRRTNSTNKTKVEKDESPLSYEEAMEILLEGEPESAVLLRGLRNREGMTQSELGYLIGIPQTNISKMEKGKRPIGKNIAKRLAKLFHTDYRIFL